VAELGHHQARKGGHNNLLPNGGQPDSIYILYLTIIIVASVEKEMTTDIPNYCEKNFNSSVLPWQVAGYHSKFANIRMTVNIKQEKNCPSIYFYYIASL
jgi:hypothetical protein